MADKRFEDRLSDYVQVNERIIAFGERFPEGSLQSEIYLLNDDVVVMKAYAYRAPDDQRPGVGWSSLQIPGTTPYTKGSEIENCETSAWGRALAALGFEVKRGIASRNEIDNKEQQANAKPTRFQPKPPQPREEASRPPWADDLNEALELAGLKRSSLSVLFGEVPDGTMIDLWLQRHDGATPADLVRAAADKMAEAAQ